MAVATAKCRKLLAISPVFKRLNLRKRSPFANTFLQIIISEIHHQRCRSRHLLSFGFLEKHQLLLGAAARDMFHCGYLQVVGCLRHVLVFLHRLFFGNCRTSEFHLMTDVRS
jgi:hypothetical protein